VAAHLQRQRLRDTGIASAFLVVSCNSQFKRKRIAEKIGFIDLVRLLIAFAYSRRKAVLKIRDADLFIETRTETGL
jgi:hypothetical protein